jgi:hypothetical protein
MRQFSTPCDRPATPNSAPLNGAISSHVHHSPTCRAAGRHRLALPLLRPDNADPRPAAKPRPHKAAIEGLQPRRQPRPGLLPLQSRQGLAIAGPMAQPLGPNWRPSRAPRCGLCPAVRRRARFPCHYQKDLGCGGSEGTPDSPERFSESKNDSGERAARGGKHGEPNRDDRAGALRPRMVTAASQSCGYLSDVASRLEKTLRPIPDPATPVGALVEERLPPLGRASTAGKKLIRR